jgi:hypothetical protein
MHDPVAVLDRERRSIAEANRRADQRRLWDAETSRLVSEIQRTLRNLLEPWEADDKNDLTKFDVALHQFVQALEAAGALIDILSADGVDPSAAAICRVAIQETHPFRLGIRNESILLLKNEPLLVRVRIAWTRMATIAIEQLGRETARRFPAPPESGRGPQ